MDESYYQKLTDQRVRELRDDLRLCELAICVEHKYVQELKSLYLQHKTLLADLQRDHEGLDRELAKLDGRHVQCAEPKKENKKRARTGTSTASPRDVVAALSPKQKQELLAALADL
jgi:chromosome segregation ATPase